MQPSNKNKFLRISGIIIGSLLLIGIIFSFWLSSNYERIIKNKLSDWVYTATNGTYHASVDDVSLNILTGHIVAANLKLWPDTTRIKAITVEGHAPTTQFTVTIPHVNISGVAWMQLLRRKELSCNRLELQNPDADILSVPGLYDSLHRETPSALEVNKERKSPAIHSMHADVIVITKPDVWWRVHNKEGNYFTIHMQDGHAVLDDWTFNHDTKRDTGLFLYAGNSVVNFGRVAYAFRKYHREFSASTTSLVVNTATNRLDAENLRFTAITHEISGGKTFLHGTYDLYCAHAALNRFYWRQLLSNKTLAADSLLLPGMVLDCYSNNSPIDNDWRGRYPQQWFQSVSFPIFIDCLPVRHAVVRFTEYNTETQRKGYMVFDNMNGGFKHLDNRDHSAKNHCIVDLHSNYKNKGSIQANFNLFLGDTLGRFTLDAVVQQLDASVMKDEALALSKLDLRSGNVNRSTVHLQGDQNNCRGNIGFAYDNLRIGVDNVSGEDVKKKVFTSFVANTFLVHHDNPSNDRKELRQPTMYVERRYQSFFRLIWNTISQGIQKTVVPGETAREKRTGEDGKTKPGVFKKIFGRILK